MISSLDDTLRVHETALRIRSQRQELLASNIANADTPNYKARDIDFTAALKSALAPTTPSGGLLVTDQAHLSGSTARSSLSNEHLLYRQPSQGNIDGNTVDMDTERNQFTENALRYEAGIAMVTNQLRQLNTALQGN